VPRPRQLQPDLQRRLGARGVALTDTQTGRAPELSSGAPPVLRLRGVTKWFPGVQALRGVDFDLRPGEVHVLFGENGAGNSTLINIVAGALRPDAGEIELRGRPGQVRPVHDARPRGISPLFPEVHPVPGLHLEGN